MERYSRQMLFSPIGENGQKRIRDSSVLVVGAGALGTVICSHLVRAGIGNLRIVDRDFVELSNLQRQMLFDEEDVKQALPKAIAAKQKLMNINSEVEIESIIANVTIDNIYQFIEDVDVVLDGTDNFSTRFLLNDICFKRNIPFSYGGVVGSRGMTAFFIPNLTSCLRCFVTKESSTGQTCDTIGVIAPAVDIVSSYQVAEVIKYLTGNKEALRHTLRTFDMWYNQQYDIDITKPNPNCPCCQQQRFPALEKQAQKQEIVLCGRNTVQIHEKDHLNLNEWEDRLATLANTKKTPFLLKVHFDRGIDFILFPDGRVLIQGTEDIVAARTLYDRYIGS